MRLLTKKEAASYCGTSVATFGRMCPVRPIALQFGNPRLLRYDLKDLDAWIDSLKNSDKAQDSPELDSDQYLARLGR
jgi:hypothetical protein